MPANRLQNLPDVGREQVLKWGMIAFASDKFIEKTVSAARAEIMERREFMSTPRRKPVGPTQVQSAIRGEEFVNGINKLSRLNKVFIDIGTNHHVIFPKRSEERRVGKECRC